VGLLGATNVDKIFRASARIDRRRRVGTVMAVEWADRVDWRCCDFATL